MTEASSQREPLSSDIRTALEKIEQSPNFREKSRASAILRYVVTEELEGRGGLLKAYPIGVDVLGRSPDFDPSADSIVRVEVKRLRVALDKYYTTAGKDDPVIIELPKGSYRPAFQLREQTAPVDQKTSQRPKSFFLRIGVLAAVLLAAIAALTLTGNKTERAEAPEMAKTAITVLVRPRPQTTATGAEKERVDNLVGQLRASLARNDGLGVFAPSLPKAASNDIPTEFDFVLEGSVEMLADEDRLSVELLNGRTNELAWGGTVKIDRAGGGSIQDEAITKMAQDISPRIFGASKAALEGRDPKTLTAYQLFVASTWIPGFAENSLKWEKERLELAKMALEVDPEFGPAHSVLADKLAYLATADPPSNTPQALLDAAASARRAQQLSPGDANALFNVAIYHWHIGEMKEAGMVLRRVIDLDPNHSFARSLLAVFPYTCAAPPDDILLKAQEFDGSLGPDNPVRWVTLTWLGMLHLNRGEFEAALEAEERAAQIFQTPDTVTRRAAILYKLGRTSEAAEVINAQREAWPNLDPAHYAQFTIPMRCHESSQAGPLIAAYDALASAVGDQLD